MSRESLIEAYIAALPFVPVTVVAIPGDSRCRVETAAAAPGAPGEKTIARYYFKPSHIELVLGAAGLGCEPCHFTCSLFKLLLPRALPNQPSYADALNNFRLSH